MFDGEAGNGHNGAGLKAEDAHWRSDRVLEPAERFWFQARTHKRGPGSVSVDTLRKPSAEDEAWERKRPPDVEEA